MFNTSNSQPGPPRAKRPAPTHKQDSYELLRAHLLTTLRREWSTLCAASPAVSDAADALALYVNSNPHFSFRIFRPEDAGARQESGDSLFLR